MSMTIAQADSPQLDPRPEIVGPYGKLPTLARELNPKETKTYEISPLEEMRFEVETTNQIHIWMSKGQAEIFGSELSTDRIYTFLKGSKLSIWSWTGCQIQIDGKPDGLYKTKESRVMAIHFNFHNCLEQKRQDASREDLVGPRVLIVGHANTGRSSLSRILLNYAARMRGEDRRNPVFVDLDFVQPDLSVAGTIACCQFDRPADPMYDFLFHRKYVLPYGYASPKDNPDLLNLQIRRMGAIIEQKFQKDVRARHSGVIVNMFAWNKQQGFDHLFVAAKAFRANFIVVIEDEGLHSQIQSHTECQELQEKFCPDLQVIKFPKSGGVVKNEHEEKRLLREARLRHNIYGHPLRSPKHEPFVHELDFSEIKLYKLGDPSINVGLLPSTMDPAKAKAAPYVVSPTGYLLRKVVYVTNVESADKVNTEGSVIGYLLVKEVDQRTRKITFLSNFQEIPKKILLTSSIQLQES